MAEQRMPEPLRFSYRLETRADRHRTWRAMSDTDAFNKAANAGFDYPTELDASGRRVPTGHVKKLGLTIRFREEAFSFRAPSWFRIRRIFDGGPAAELVATAALTEGATGTAIDYTLEVMPRSGLFRPLLALDLRRTTEKWVGEALRSIAQALDDGAEDLPERSLLGPPPRLSKEGAARLESLLASMPPSHFAPRLAAFLRGAPEREQLMMAPIALAQAWIAPLDETVEYLVEGARRGLLSVRIDLLCPACLVPRMPAELGGGPPVHCEGCGITLDQSFPEALAVHFSPSPQIRTIEAKIHCLGSPSRTPHVVAQETVPPGAEADLATELAPGTYQLRTIPAFGPAALIEVNDSETEREARFTVRATLQPQLSVLRPLPRCIGVKNERDTPFVVVLERLVPPRRVLTLGRMLAEFPSLRDIVPNAGFFSRMTCFTGAAIAVRAPSPEAATRIASGLGRAKVTHASDCVVLAAYGNATEAIDDLAGLDREGAMFSLAGGTIFEHLLGKRVVPMGPAIDRAHDLLGASGVGRLAIPRESTTEGELAELVRGRGLSFVPSPAATTSEPAVWLAL